MTKREFIPKLQNASIQAINQGAIFNKPVLFAQAALESGWGNSSLAIKANNLLGIKAGAGWKGRTISLITWEWEQKRGWYKTLTKWCAWESWVGCILYYAELLETLPWFKSSLDHLVHADEFLKALLPGPNKPGWATEPDYYSKVKRTGIEIQAMGGPKWE